MVMQALGRPIGERIYCVFRRHISPRLTSQQSTRHRTTKSASRGSLIRRQGGPRVGATKGGPNSGGRRLGASWNADFRQKQDFAVVLHDRLKAVRNELRNAPILNHLGDDPDQVFRTLWRAFTESLDRSAPFADQRKEYQTLRHAYHDRGIDALDDRLKYAFYDHVTGSRFTASDIQNQKTIADLRYPAEWFPATRTYHRQIHLHVGPTNSGKTYHALQRLEQANSGLYAGPLRLLAHEVYTRLNAKGKRCLLTTGEEKRLPPDDDPTMPTMSSCTVEMIPLNAAMDVAVIDEIQMIGNPDRGWAWTQALLGVKAKEVHLCGEARTVPIIRQLCASVGEELIVHHYERLSPLSMADKTLDGDLSKLRKGDCIVSFSVMGIHALRKEIEKVTKRKVATVYGSLPPETRAQQARLFNDPDNDYDFLVASDAIGMGLNLSIKRIIFESSNKFDGVRQKTLSIADIKQIGGRAGRYRSAHQQNEHARNSQQPLAFAKGEPLPAAYAAVATESNDLTMPATEHVKVQESNKQSSESVDINESDAQSTVSVGVNESDAQSTESIVVNESKTSATEPVGVHESNMPATEPVHVHESNTPASEPSEVKDSTMGLVTTLEGYDFPIIASAMNSEPEPIRTAGIFPPGAILERFASYFPPGTPFSYILMRLHVLSQMHSRFHLCGLRDQLYIADLIEPVIGLTISDRNIMCACPASKSEPLYKQLMPAFARCIEKQSGGSLLDIPELPLEVLEIEDTSDKRGLLRKLESLHKGIVAYLWLSYRFAGIFTTRPLANHVKSLVEDKIEEVLSSLSFSQAQRRAIAARKQKQLIDQGLRDEGQDLAKPEQASDKIDPSTVAGGDHFGGEMDEPFLDPIEDAANSKTVAIAGVDAGEGGAEMARSS